MVLLLCATCCTGCTGGEGCDTAPCVAACTACATVWGVCWSIFLADLKSNFKAEGWKASWQKVSLVVEVQGQTKPDATSSFTNKTRCACRVRCRDCLGREAESKGCECER